MMTNAFGYTPTYPVCVYRFIGITWFYHLPGHLLGHRIQLYNTRGHIVYFLKC